MSEAQWTTEQNRLQRAITKAHNQAKKAGDLASKVALLNQARGHEEALRQHRVNKFQLVPA